MTKPIFNKEYESGPEGVADWIAGGNFDGYLFKKSILFRENSNEVILKTTIIDQSRYDGERSDSEITGQYAYTGKDTITIQYQQLTMLGKILGKQREFIIFSLEYNSEHLDRAEVYQLK